jgi:hypothetical protein
MVMRVDEPRDDDVVGRSDDRRVLMPGGQFGERTNFLDLAIDLKDTAVIEDVDCLVVECP